MRMLLVLGALVGLGGCASFYVDGNSPEVPASQFRKPSSPSPVQLIWEFKTKGVANARATELLKPKVRDQIMASGLFASVTDAPVQSGALLALTINNIPLSDDAVSKGFVAGLTFGLAGQTVGDGYECELRFTPDRTGAKDISTQAKHVIYTNVGSAASPAGAIKAQSADEAVFTMLRQVISRMLDELSRSPAFN